MSTLPGHVVVACDKFKSSLTASAAGRAIADGLADLDPRLEVRLIPVADGGEGTLEAALAAGYSSVPVTVSGPTGAPVASAYAYRDGSAVVELADACGLQRLVDGTPAPLTASSRGAGEVIRAAIEDGRRDIVLGVGGSASTDGGTGMLTALGARFLDHQGEPLPDGGGALRRLARIDLTGLHPALAECRFTLASDVTNPLLGPTGTVNVFAAQKGSTHTDDGVLEYGVGRLATVLSVQVGRDDSARPGAGAAGGVGYAALAVLDATMRPGIELVLESVGASAAMTGARLVITGEGTLDQQTLAGKAPVGVARLAAAHGVPVAVVCGRRELSAEQVRAAGFIAAPALLDIEPDPRRCRLEAAVLLRQLVRDQAPSWLGVS